MTVSLVSSLSYNFNVTTTTEGAGDDYDVEDDVDIPPWVHGVGGVGMSVLILLAVVGNVLVIISYFRDKQLQTVHNLYILNLAIADLFLGAISMIFYADFTLRSWNWVFGRVFCKIWCVNDYSMCLMSVLLILLLSLDRVILLRNGAEYIAKETKKVAMVKISIAWVVVFGIYGPCVVFWDIAKGYSVIEDGNCDAEFFDDMHFSAISTVCELVIPCITLCVLNILVFLAIRKRLKIFDKGNKAKVVPINEPKDLKTEISNISTEVEKSFQESSHTKQKIPGSAKENKETHAKHTSDRKDIKAAKFLAVLVAAFLLTWAPYTIANFVSSQCDDCINTHLYEFFTWLLWAKSSINPFLYASQSKRFKDNFYMLLPFLKFCTKKE
ncbi:histamine H3 receptor-like [Haliotis cracherodii]|uniref:histamine H3 receptor-like n=1 Tax=Haliotis cracherodii TaxID=6455 RepID=UPI0039E7FD3E